jgi:hypothetical protein
MLSPSEEEGTAHPSLRLPQRAQPNGPRADRTGYRCSDSRVLIGKAMVSGVAIPRLMPRPEVGPKAGHQARNGRRLGFKHSSANPEEPA